MDKKTKTVENTATFEEMNLEFAKFIKQNNLKTVGGKNAKRDK